MPRDKSPRPSLIKWALSLLGAISAIVTIYTARREIGDLWHSGYPLYPLWGLAATSVLEGLVICFLLRQRLAAASLDASALRADRQLIRRFSELLPSTSPAIRLVRDPNFGGTVRLDQLDPLKQLLEEWDDAEHSFRDRKVERARRRLMRDCREFIREVQRLMRPVGAASGWYGLAEPSELENYRANPELRAVVETLNTLASKVFRAHQELLKIGNDRLANA